MSVELIPSITVTTPAQLRRCAALTQRLSSAVHLDVMDGKFVTAKSVGPSQLHTIRWKSKVEIHAMVNNVVGLLSLLDIVRPHRVYLQVERGQDMLPMIAVLRSRHIECGLAIKPTTPLHMLRPFSRWAGSILVLAVKPGRYRAPLQPSAFFRIRTLHRWWPRKTIVVDGSMNESTIKRAIRVGARRIIVGSAVMLSDDPEGQWKKLKALTK